MKAFSSVFQHLSQSRKLSQKENKLSEESEKGNVIVPKPNAEIEFKGKWTDTFPWELYAATVGSTKAVIHKIWK